MDKDVSFTLEDRSTLQDRVTRSIRKAILQGYWKDGEKIRQEDVCRMLNVSRTPVREALKLLAQEGLVTLLPHRGVVVNQITEKDIEEIYELRSRLESLCVKLAGPELTNEDFSILRNLNIKMEESYKKGDLEGYVALNRNFHDHIYQKSAWRRLNIMIGMLWNGLPPRTPTLLPDQITTSIKDHEYLVEVLEKGNFEEAARVMEKHIRRTGQEILKYIHENAKGAKINENYSS